LRRLLFERHLEVWGQFLGYLTSALEFSFCRPLRVN
jgi:hypothetical protein